MAELKKDKAGKAICINCSAPIFKPLGKYAWVHVAPRTWRCMIQSAIGYNPSAEPAR